jgi:hypothetical protein
MIEAKSGLMPMKSRLLNLYVKGERKLVDQKKLFEKKKFIYDSHYFLSLSHIDNNFWDEIVSNETQIAEWIEL